MRDILQPCHFSSTRLEHSAQPTLSPATSAIISRHQHLVVFAHAHLSAHGRLTFVQLEFNDRAMLANRSGCTRGSNAYTADDRFPRLMTWRECLRLTRQHWGIGGRKSWVEAANDLPFQTLNLRSASDALQVRTSDTADFADCQICRAGARFANRRGRFCSLMRSEGIAFRFR